MPHTSCKSDYWLAGSFTCFDISYAVLDDSAKQSQSAYRSHFPLYPFTHYFLTFNSFCATFPDSTSVELGFTWYTCRSHSLHCTLSFPLYHSLPLTALTLHLRTSFCQCLAHMFFLQLSLLIVSSFPHFTSAYLHCILLCSL